MEPTSSRDETPVAERIPQSIPWAVKIASVSGIPIYLHFTFLLFLVWLALGSFGAGERGLSFLFMLTVFACVVLHELGHALVALRFQIPVSSITLYPIGGIARIEKQPEPAHELWIALAGPAVNFVIVGLLGTYLALTGGFAWPSLTTGPASANLSHNWAQQVMGANLILAVFNLIPAFPMDGGRVLRALLSMKLPFDRATTIAANIGQLLAMMAALFAILGGNWVLLFIAFFIYLGAGQEVTVARHATLVKNVKVEEAMLTDLRLLPHGSTFREAAELLLATSQQDFPVVLGEEVVGLLPRDELLRGLAAEGPDAYVATAMRREFLRARPSDALSNLLPRMQAAPGPALVFDKDHLVGMVTTENLMEFLVIREITSHQKAAPPTAHPF